MHTASIGGPFRSLLATHPTSGARRASFGEAEARAWARIPISRTAQSVSVAISTRRSPTGSLPTLSEAACLEATLGRINELIYRINTPALRATLMAPGNRFRKRDALICLLAGNLRQIGVWCYRSWR